MAGVGDMYIEVKPDTTKFVGKLQSDLNAAANRASSGFSQRMAAGMSKVGATMTRTVTLPIAAAGGASIYMASQFESAMSKMVGLAGVPAKEIDQLKAGVLSLATETAQSPIELANALYFITSSGQSGAQALETLRISARAAASGLGETQTVADAITSVMAAYGASNISAARTADILTASVKFGKAEASELSEGIGNLAPLASQLGVGFDQLGASIAAMTMVGVDTDTAFTNMSAIFSGLLKVTPQAADQLALVGLNADDLRQTIKQPGGLLVALREIDTAFGGNEEAMAQVFPNIRALRGVMALLAQNGEQVDKVFQGVTNSVGDADHAFKTAAQTSAFQFEKGLAKLQVAAIKVGEALLPIAGKVVDAVGDMADAFNELPDWSQNFIIGGAAAAAMLGPVLRLTGGILSLGQGMMGVAPAMAGATSNAGFLASALGELPAAFGPVGIAAAGIITALAIAFDASAVNQFEVEVSGAMARIRDQILETGQVNSLGTAKWVEDELRQKGALQEVYDILGEGGVTFQQYYDALMTSSDGTGQWVNQLGLGAGAAYRLLDATGALDVSLLRAQQSTLNQAKATGNLTAIQGVFNQSIAGAAFAVGNLRNANNGALPPLSSLKDEFALTAEAANAHAEAVVASTGNAADAIPIFDSYKAALADQLVVLGYTREEAELYAGALLNIPGEVPPTTLTLLAEKATADLRTYLGFIGFTPEVVNTIMHIRKEEGSTAVREYLAELNLTPEQIDTIMTAVDNASAVIDNVNRKGAAYGASNPRTGIHADDRTGPSFGAAQSRASVWRISNPSTGIWAADYASATIAAVQARLDSLPESVTVRINAVPSGFIPGASTGYLPPGGQHGGPVSGMTWVGEAGKELALFPRGSRVITAQESARYMRQVASASSARTVTGTPLSSGGGGTIDASSLHIAARRLIAAAAVLADATPGRQARAAFQNGIT